MNDSLFIQQKNRESRSKANNIAVSSVAPIKQGKSHECNCSVADKKLLKMPRTNAYIHAMQNMDAPSETDKKIMNDLQTKTVNNKLLGILAECGIPGCIIHAIDKWGNIINHFQSLEEMDSDLREGYHVFTQHPGCVSVEVYTFTFCVLYDDGTVKFIERE